MCTDKHAPNASSRWDGHTGNDLSSYHTMRNYTPNGIRAHNERHTIANDPDNLHAMSNHTQNDPRAHTPTATPSPRPAWAYSC